MNVHARAAQCCYERVARRRWIRPADIVIDGEQIDAFADGGGAAHYGAAAQCDVIGPGAIRVRTPWAVCMCERALARHVDARYSRLRARAFQFFAERGF